MKKQNNIFLLILFIALFSSCNNEENNKIIEEPIDEQSKINRDPDDRKDFANVYWKKQYTLFDLITDEPIFPVNVNGTLIYKIYYSSNEDPNPYYKEFTAEQLENNLFYKFKNKENCMIFCNRKKQNENGKKPDPNITYSLKEALANDFIKISADGNGTYRNIKLNLENKSDASCKLTLTAGLYFENPDDKSQSLITAKKIDIITIDDKQKFSLDVPSFCTNVKQSVPGLLKDWNHNPNYNGGLDEVIAFYGKYEKGINKWLEKKNKEFSDENKRMLFFQTVIWYHEGAQYQEILEMLKNDVFKNDIEKAKVWLDNIQQEASQLAQLIKERDSEKIKTWLKEKTLELIPTSEQVDEAVDKGKKTLDKFRNRLKGR